MSKKRIILVSYILAFAISLSGQCPNRDLLWKRLMYLKDAAKLPPATERSELFGYLEHIENCPYKYDSTHAYILRRISRLFSDQGDYLKAAQYLHQAIGITSSNASKPSVKVRDLVVNYYFLSVYYDSLSSTVEKMKAIDSCIDYAIKLNIPSDISCVRSLYARVEYFFDMGDYQRCIDDASMCEKRAREFATSTTNKTYVLLGTFYAESSLGWKIKAMLRTGDYKALEDLLIEKTGEYKKAKLDNYLGFAYGQLADVYGQKGDFDKALLFLNRSLQYYQRVKDHFNCKQTLKDIGNYYFRHFGDANTALVNYRKALTYINTEKEKAPADVFESLDIYGQMANVYVANNRYDSAFHYFRLAFDQIKPGTSEVQILASPSAELIKYKKLYYLSSLFIDKGDAFKQQCKNQPRKQTIRAAIYSYKYADQLLGRIKAEQSDLESKLFWRRDSRRLYEHAIDACFLSGDINNAFYFFEKSRAVLLQDQLNEQRWLGEKDIMKQTQLNKKILQLERELKGTDKSSKQYSQLQNQLFATKQEFENIKALIKSNNPLYYQNFMTRDSITVADVQQKILNDHQALVELFAGDSAVYVLAITNQRSYLQKINKTVFESLSNAYVRYLSNQDLLNRDFYSFADISNQLYQVIFRNINLPAGRIILSPDGRYFPFESLVTRKQPVGYFLENFAVSYTYSARYLLNNFLTNSSARSRTFFGIAPVSYTNSRLATLSGSDQSLQTMQTYFRNSTSFVGAKATKNNFLSEYYRYKIVQLYTHATDSSSSGDPAIYFADSTLFLSDLFYENRPASSLIVLSACETANGKLYNGEGVFSFNRQFAALGIPSCISTLWQADNQSTYRITELFYKYLADGQPMDIAMQSAKKEFYKSSNLENKLPYYWAASILVGKSDSIQLQKPFPLKWAIAAAAILGLVSLGTWQVKRRKTQKNKKK